MEKPDLMRHFVVIIIIIIIIIDMLKEELAVASIARDDHSTLPGDNPSRPHAPRPQCAVNWDRNLKPKLAIMRHCTSVTDRQTDTDIVA